MADGNCIPCPYVTNKNGCTYHGNSYIDWRDCEVWPQLVRWRRRVEGWKERCPKRGASTGVRT